MTKMVEKEVWESALTGFESQRELGSNLFFSSLEMKAQVAILAGLLRMK